MSYKYPKRTRHILSGIVILVVLLLIFTTNIFGQLSEYKNHISGFVQESVPGFKKKVYDLKRPPLHPEYDVLGYSIDISLDHILEKIRASNNIKINVISDIPDILSFDFEGLQVDSVFFDTLSVQTILQDELLSIQLPAMIMAGDTHLIQIYYQGTPEKGLYFRNNSFNNPVIYSHNEPYDAHFWFPCKDDPSDKAKLLMKITAPEEIEVLSNGDLISTADDGIGNTTVIWKVNYPIATYLISMAAGFYEVVQDSFSWDQSDMPLQYYVYPEDTARGKMALGMVDTMLGYYSEYIGEYPFILEKYAMSEVPLREAAAMENQTATTMGDFVMDNENVLAHELVHQWWGDALTPASFVDIWLNEGFATYFDALFTEFKYGNEAFQQVLDNFKSRMNSDGSLAFPVYDPPEEFLFGAAVYMKGAWILHMLRMEVGYIVFRDIFRVYFEEHKYQNVRTTDFITVAENVSGKSLTTFFNQWLNYGGIPVIIGSWEQGAGIVEIILNQEQNSPIYQFNLDILLKGVKADTLLSVAVTQRQVQLQTEFSDPVSQIIIDPDNKILNSNNGPLFYIPDHSKLVNLYPNPSREGIIITYQLEKNQKVDISVYDILGKKVDTLLQKKQNIGLYSISWSANNNASGTFFCVMKLDKKVDTKKFVLIK